MKLTPIPLRNKLPNTWKRLLKSLKYFRLKKLVFIRTLESKYKTRTTRRRRVRIISILPCIKPSRDMDRVMKLKSFSDVGYSIKDPFPSPLTPAYVRLSAYEKIEVSSSKQEEDLEDAFRSFEKYLIEMIVEDGKMTNLEDVEELLCCLKSLKCPVFIDLVCRFYGELCKDLFSNANQDE